MEADNIAGGKRTQKTSCVGLYPAVYCDTFHPSWIVWYAGPRMFVVGVGCGSPPSGSDGIHYSRSQYAVAVLTAAIPMLRFERRPFSDLGLSLKGHVKGLWYGLLMAILLYLFGFGISFVLGEIEVTGFQFKPLDLLGSWVFFLLVALFEEILMRGYILGRLLHTTMNKFLALLSRQRYSPLCTSSIPKSLSCLCSTCCWQVCCWELPIYIRATCVSLSRFIFSGIDSRPHPRLSGKRKQLHHQYADFAYARRKRTEWRSLRF